MYICWTVAIAMTCCAAASAQEVPLIADDVLILEPEVVGQSVIESNAVEPALIIESTAVLETDPNAPIIIECEDSWQDTSEQCVVIKKSVLGCLEGIAILPQDEVWLINARDCICGETDLSLLKVSQYNGSELVPRELSDLTSAHASGDEYATVLYIHGNQTDKEFATARGLQVYRNAFATKADCHGPVRYVIWAWKSEQEKFRLYPDYVVKSERSVRLGETFAATLNQFSDRNLIVFGYSLGVQVVLSAFDSPTLDTRDGDPTRYQVVFAAPAINPDFVARNLLKCDCDSPAQQALIFTNRKDRAIRAARAIIRRKNPNNESTIAGLSATGKLNLGAITSVDVFGETGRFHSIERYTRSDTMQNMMADLVNVVSANRIQFEPTVDAPESSTLAK